SRRPARRGDRRDLSDRAVPGVEPPRASAAPDGEPGDPRRLRLQARPAHPGRVRRGPADLPADDLDVRDVPVRAAGGPAGGRAPRRRAGGLLPQLSAAAEIDLGITAKRAKELIGGAAEGYRLREAGQ